MNELIDKFGIDLKILGAEIFNFLVLVWFLWYFVYRKVILIIQERQEKIDDGLKKSEEADRVLELAKKEKSEIITEARKEASEKIKKAKSLGEIEAEKIISEAKAESNELKKKAEVEGEEKKQKIINSSKDEIAKMIVLGAEKILAEK